MKEQEIIKPKPSPIDMPEVAVIPPRAPSETPKEVTYEDVAKNPSGAKPLAEQNPDLQKQQANAKK